MAGIELSAEKTAQFFGVDPRTISNWVRNGCPGKKDGRGRWSLNSAEIADWLRLRERESALGEVTAIDEQEARRRKIAAEAALAEHELALKQGAAVAIADYEAQLAGMIGAARAKLLNLGSKLAPLVIQCGTPAEAKDVIDNGVREVLRELSEYDGADIPDQSTGQGSTDSVVADGGEAVVTASGPDRERVVRRKSAPKSRS